jgi:hypothetical protein
VSETSQGSEQGGTRPVVVVDSHVYWPMAKNIRFTPNGFEIDLKHDGTFSQVMGYEFVSQETAQ